MEQLKSFKVRIYPTALQETQLAQCFGAKRWIYNHFLSEQKRRVSTKEKHLSNFDINKLITQMKKDDDTKWLSSIDDWCLKHASEDLSIAYKNFFSSIKGIRKGKKLEQPTFKKRTNRQSYRTRGVKVSPTGIRLPKFKEEINVIWHQTIPSEAIIKSATISKTPSGKYFVSVLCSINIELKSMSAKEVGIDLGIKDLLITSDGIKFDNPLKHLTKTKQLLKRQQKKLSRKKHGSKKYDRVRIQVAKTFEYISNFKKNYYHLISDYLVSNYDAIYMEDININGMLKNRKLSRAIHEIGWSSLVSMIQYKCDWYGKTFHKINRWTPSSKTCSCCGYKLNSMDLSVRDWICPSCGIHHDRDLNAAINIKNTGQKDLYDTIISSATEELESKIPAALKKHVVKIERSVQ